MNLTTINHFIKIDQGQDTSDDKILHKEEQKEEG